MVCSLGRCTLAHFAHGPSSLLGGLLDCPCVCCLAWPLLPILHSLPCIPEKTFVFGWCAPEREIKAPPSWPCLPASCTAARLLLLQPVLVWTCVGGPGHRPQHALHFHRIVQSPKRKRFHGRFLLRGTVRVHKPTHQPHNDNMGQGPRPPSPPMATDISRSARRPRIPLRISKPPSMR